MPHSADGPARRKFVLQRAGSRSTNNWSLWKEFASRREQGSECKMAFHLCLLRLNREYLRIIAKVNKNLQTSFFILIYFFRLFFFLHSLVFFFLLSFSFLLGCLFVWFFSFSFLWLSVLLLSLVSFLLSLFVLLAFSPPSLFVFELKMGAQELTQLRIRFPVCILKCRY